MDRYARLSCAGGNSQEAVAGVTRRSVRRMCLKVGEEVLAVIKSTEVMLYG
jgi:molybdopterin-binding protein